MKTRLVCLATPGRPTVLASLLALTLPVCASDLVISQIYGGGGNSGSVYANDFIELFNSSGAPISLSGKSVQYASAAGSSWAVSVLPDKIIQPGQYFLVQQAQGSDTSHPLPTADASGALTMSGSTGKVALVAGITALSGANPTTGVLDRIGYGPTASSFEGAPTAVLNNGSGARRVNPCVDTDQNATDFAIGTPVARNSASPLNACSAGAAPIVPVCPASLSVPAGQARSLALSASDSDSIVNSALISSAAVPGISLSFTAASAVSASASASLQVSASLASGVYPLTIGFGNDAGQQASCTVTVGVEGTHTIPQLQGSGAVSPYNNTVQTTSGVVTHKLSNGFFLQDPVGDGDPATSDGIFVFTGGAPGVSVGQQVQVKGTVTEYTPAGAADSYTEIKDLQLPITVLGTGPAIVPVNVAFDGHLERFEGMLVSFTNTLTVNETSYLGERGELTLSLGRRETATNRYRPGTPEAIALAAANASNVITLDDNIFVTPTTIPYLGVDGTVRAGDSVTSLTGVIDYGATGGGGAPFKLQPTSAPVFSRTNPRTPAPDIAAGNVRVASANVLNFFTTFLDGSDAWGGTGKGFTVGATTSASNCRGADNLAEFVRQRDKIVAELKAIDADAVGLMEIQNNGDIAVDYLVKSLNAAIGQPLYAYVPAPPARGTDAIRVAMIYKPASLSLIGAALSDGDAVNNRAPMAQTFKANNGAVFSLVVNHMKSKGGCGGGANADLGDGQGCNNATRVAQAQRLASYFLPAVVASAGDPDVLVIGDLNAHGFEDPIALLTGPAAGLVNELERFVRPTGTPYSYVFDGESGYLDHALASASLDRQVAGATEWHNNADEPTVIDYNLDGKSAAAQALYGNDAYRASDHDPVVVSLNLAATFIDISASVTVQRSGLVANRATGKYSGTITLTNTSGAALTGPFQLRFDRLPAGVTLEGASGTQQGAPYLTLATSSLAPGARLTVNVVFSNPSKAVIGYGNTIFSGNF